MFLQDRKMESMVVNGGDGENANVEREMKSCECGSMEVLWRGWIVFLQDRRQS